MVVPYLWFSRQSWSHFHLVFSWQWLGLDDVLPGSVSQILGHLGIVALVLEAGVMVDLGICHRQGKMVFLLWQGWMLLCSLWELDWCICPNLIDPFCTVSWVQVWDTCERLLASCYFEGGKVWKKCDQSQVVWSTWSMRWFLNSVPLSHSMYLGHMWTGR